MVACDQIQPFTNDFSRFVRAKNQDIQPHTFSYLFYHLKFNHIDVLFSICVVAQSATMHISMHIHTQTLTNNCYIILNFQIKNMEWNKKLDCRMNAICVTCQLNYTDDIGYQCITSGGWMVKTINTTSTRIKPEDFDCLPCFMYYPELDFVLFYIG